MVSLTPFIQGIIAYLVEHPDQTAAAVAAVGGTVFNYRKTGNFPIGRLPWSYFRRLLDDLSDKYFGVRRPRGVPALHIPEPPERVKRKLRERHYESADVMGYDYEGEVWTLRRPSGLFQHPRTGEDIPMETHARGFRTEDDGTLVICHDEASRFEATGDHLSETVMSWPRGREYVVQDCEELGLGYEQLDSEAANPDLITVVPN